jgi:hypothetical protein
MEQQNNLRKDYLSKGYIIIKSIFTKEYISKIRQDMINLSSKDMSKYEILLDEDSQKLLLNEKLIKTIKEILNTNTLLYYSDSSVVNHINPFKNRNGFHNDARGEDENLPYDQEYPIIRAAVYFEDYKNFSGGLKIKNKSHKYFIFNFRRILADTLRLIKILFTKTRYNLNALKLGESVNLELEQGDVVIWNLRTHHCGTSRRLKLFPKMCLQPFFERMLPEYFYLPTQYKQDRCAIFTTFAKNDLSNTNILGYLKKKTNFLRLSQIKKNSNLMNRLNELNCKLPDNF